MEIFTAGIGLMQKFVSVGGGAMVIIGLIMFLMAQSESNAAQKTAGMWLVVSGGAIAVVGMTLIPMLANIG